MTCCARVDGASPDGASAVGQWYRALEIDLTDPANAQALPAAGDFAVVTTRGPSPINLTTLNCGNPPAATATITAGVGLQLQLSAGSAVEWNASVNLRTAPFVHCPPSRVDADYDPSRWGVRWWAEGVAFNGVAQFESWGLWWGDLTATPIPATTCLEYDLRRQVITGGAQGWTSVQSGGSGIQTASELADAGSGADAVIAVQADSPLFWTPRYANAASAWPSWRGLSRHQIMAVPSLGAGFAAAGSLRTSPPNGVTCGVFLTNWHPAAPSGNQTTITIRRLRMDLRTNGSGDPP